MLHREHFQFENEVEALYREHFEFRPATAVDLGHHEYDGKLPDISGDSIQAEIARLHRAKQTLEAMNGSALKSRGRLEHEVMLEQVRSELFSLETSRNPWRNPMYYTGLVSAAPLDLTFYISRDYAPLEHRARAIISIGRGAGRFLSQARKNLEESIPRAWLATAIGQLEGMIPFVRQDVREAMSGIENRSLVHELGTVLDELARELESFRDFLVARKAQATEEFALGEQRFLRLLAASQSVVTDLATLQQAAERDLERNLAAIEQAARCIDPARSVREVVLAVAEEKPPADQVLAEAARQTAEARAFVLEHDLATILSDESAEIRESPPFKRLNAALLSTAGGCEPKPLPSFYYITLPDPSWPPEQQRGYVPPRMDLLFITVHEVWPGHFLDDLHAKRNPSPILRSFWSAIRGEGWAHYCEEMMFEQGFGSGDPRAHIGQLKQALLRNVRFLAALGLHTGRMSVEQAAALFCEKAFAATKNAEQQAARGTFDPMYLSYTLGKLLVLKLREDWKARMGESYSLKAFHDAFLSHGWASIPALRREMLGPDSGPVL